MNSPVRRVALLLALVLTAPFGRAGDAVEVIPPAWRGAAQPQVAVAPGGRVFVAFGKGTNVYCTASAGTELKFSDPTEVAVLPKLALGMRRGPRIVATDTTVTLSAVSHAEGNLYSWTSSDGGTTWSAAARINSVTNSAREGMHAMTGDARGHVHAVWLDLRNGKTELWSASSRDAGRTWGTNHLVYQSPDGHICECCHPSVAVDAQGRVWAMWRNWLDGARDMFVSVSRDGGETFSPARKLGLGTWPLKGCPMDGGSLAFAADGRLLTVWRRDRSILTAGEKGEKLLSAQGLQPIVTDTPGGPCYFWQSGPKLMCQRTGREPETFAAQGAYVSAASANARSAPVVVWEGTSEGAKTILARRLD